MKSKIQKIVNKIYELQFLDSQKLVDMAGEAIDYIWEKVVEAKPTTWKYIAPEDPIFLKLPNYTPNMSRLDCLLLLYKLLDKVDPIHDQFGSLIDEDEDRYLEEGKFWGDLVFYIYDMIDIVDFRDKL